MVVAAVLVASCASSSDTPLFRLHTSPVGAGPEAFVAGPVQAPAPAPREPVPALLRPYMFGESAGFAYVDSLTFALYEGVTRGRALELLSAGGALSPIESAEAAYQAARSTHGLLLARKIGRWTLVLDLRGDTVINRRTLTTLSLPHAAAAFHTDLAADYRFVYARAGQVVRDFDPVDYLDNGPVQDRLAEEQGIGFGSLSSVYPTARSLLLIRRLTGIRLRAADFSLSGFALGVVMRRR
jgi:hypothetical protein